MELRVDNRLIVDKDDDYFELETGDNATVWFKNGQCCAIEIKEINDNGMTIIDEDDELGFILYEDIGDIEQG